MSNLMCFLIVAVRKVAAGHRMIVEGWELFEEAVEEGAPGDLPALLRQLKGITTPQPLPPTPVDLTQDSDTTGAKSTSPSPAKKMKVEVSNETPVMIIMGGNRSWACPQCNTVRGSKNGCDAHIRQAHTGKALVCAFCAFPHTIWTRCRGMRRNTSKMWDSVDSVKFTLLFLVLYPFCLVSSF